MRKSILLTIILLTPLFLCAQQWQWANRFSQNPNVNKADVEFSISSIQISQQGNVFVGGYFISNIKYGENIFYGYPDVNSVKPDIFLFKLDPNGDLIWGKTFGTEANELLDDVIVDSEENAYISCRIQTSQVNFGNNVTATSTGRYDGIVVKFNSFGKVQWGINLLKGTTQNDRILGLTLSNDETKLYAAGAAKSPDFSIGNNSYSNPFGQASLCAASVETNDGSVNWTSSYPSNNIETLFNEISCDKDGAIYAAGALYGSVTIGSNTYSSKGGADLLLVKINPNNGEPYWVVTGGGSQTDIFHSVNSKEEYIYSIGYINGVITIDSVATAAPKIQSSPIGSSNTLKMFISKYNLEGRLLWKKVLDGGGLGYNLNVNLQDNILVATGYFSGSMDFNLNSISSNGGTDAAYFVFDTEGNPISAKAIKGNGSYEDRGQAIFLDENFDVILGGRYNSPQVEFINGETTFKTLTNDYAGYPEGFIAKCTNDYVTTFTNKKNVTCYGGSDGELTITPYFGHSPYTYSWEKDGVALPATDSAITNLTPGVYAVTVVDGENNSITNSYTLTQPNDINVTLAATNVACFDGNNGSIEITSTTGGNGDYSYFWSTEDGFVSNATLQNQTGLIIGNYNLTVIDIEGCIKTASQVITQGEPISITGNVTNITNSGDNGAIDISVTGGIGGFSYSWSYGNSTPFTTQDLTGLSDAGNYTVTVTDENTCSSQASFIVPNENFLFGYKKSKTDVRCKGGSTGAIELNYVGTSNPVSVSWKKDGQTYDATGLSISNLSAGTYEATLSANGEVNSVVTVEIEEPSDIVSGAITPTDATCKGNSNGSLLLIPTGGAIPYTYAWSGSQLSNTVTTQNVNRLKAGSYSVVITDANGCSSEPITGTVNEPDLIDFEIIEVSPDCYNSENGSMEVTNITGGDGNYTYLWSNTLTATRINNLKAGYYRLTVTDGNRCYTQKTERLEQPATVRMGISGQSNTSCPEKSDGNIRLSSSGGVAPYTWVWTDSENNIIGNSSAIYDIGVGTYTATLTDANLCSSTTSITLQSTNSSPSPILTCVDTVSCAGSQVTFNGTGLQTARFEFLINDSIARNYSVTSSFSTSGLNDNDIVTMKAQSSAGCEATSSPITIIRNSLPNISIDATSDTICNGSSTRLTATGANTYSWDNGIVNGEDFTPIATNTYTVTGTDNNGCSSTAQKSIVVNEIPTATISTNSNTTWCIGDNIEVLMTSGTADSYQWIKDDVEVVDSTNQTFTANQAGNYKVKINVDGCIAESNAIQVVENTNPTVSVESNSVAICQGEELTLTASGDATSYTWSDGIIDGTAFIPTETHTYTVTGTNNNNCSSTQDVLVTVKMLPSGNITTTDPTSWCEGSDVNFTLSVSDTTSTLQWLLNGTPIEGATQVQFNGTEAGAYTVSMTDNGCSALSDSITISTSTKPTVSAMASNIEVCAGNSVVLYGDGAETYSWDNDVTDSVAFVPPTSTTYTVIGTDVNGCSDTAQVSITVNSYPEGSIATTDPISWCEGSDINFTLTASDTTSTLQWLLNGTPIEGATQTQFNGTEAGTYTVSMTSNGCSALSDTITVSTTPKPTVSAMASNIEVCAGDSVVLYGNGAETYSWDNDVTDSVAFVPLTSATYTVIGTDVNGCSDTAQVSITVNSYPEGSIATTDPISWCEGSDINFTLTASDTTSTLQWLLNGTPIDGATQAQFNGTEAGTYTVAMTSNGCSALSDTITISTTPKPTVSAMASNIEVCAGDSVILYGYGAETYLWDNDVTDSVAFVPLSSATYTVIGTDVNGCSDTAQVNILVKAIASSTISATQTTWCSNDTIEFTFSADTADQYQWYFNNELIEGATEQTYTDSIEGSYNAVLIKNGCITYSDSVAITVNIAPIVGIIASDTIVFEGDSITLSGTGADTYQWDNNVTDGLAFVVDSTSTYTVIGTDINGCSNLAEIEIIASPSIIVTIATTDTLLWCQGDSIEVTMSIDTIANSYQWLRNGIAIENATDSVFTANEAGEYNVQLAINDRNYFSNIITVTSFELPQIGIEASDTIICAGDSITLTANGALSYTWSNNVENGTLFVPEISSEFSVIGTDVNGCSSSSSIFVAVNSTTAKINTTDPTIWCAGSDINVNFTVEESESYQWLFNNVPIDSATSQSYTANAAGVYGIIATNGICVATDTIEIFEVETPTIGIVTDDTTEWCAGNASAVTLVATLSDAVSYQWMKNGENIAAAIGTIHTTNEAGYYTLFATFGGNNCSATSDTLTITEFPLPAVDLPNDSIIINNTESYTLDAGEGFEYLWSVGDSTIELENNTSQTFVVNGNVLGVGVFTFNVVVTSEHGCVASDSAVVKVRLEDFIITQNDWETKIYPNPTSDCFMLNINGIEGRECYIKVFNSTGMLVQNRVISVEGNSLNEQFDFSSQAKGVYHVVIQNEGKVQTCKVVLK